MIADDRMCTSIETPKHACRTPEKAVGSKIAQLGTGSAAEVAAAPVEVVLDVSFCAAAPDTAISSRAASTTAPRLILPTNCGAVADVEQGAMHRSN